MIDEGVLQGVDDVMNSVGCIRTGEPLVSRAGSVRVEAATADCETDKV